MNLKQLESFSYIIETSSFSEAAKKLYLTQPTISSHISLLEKELNTQLLIRTTKDVTPTKDGKKLYTYAKQILQLHGSILDEFNVKNQNENNILALGASTIPEQYILPEILPKYLKKNRNEFKIYQGDSLDIINKVSNKEIEVGLVGTQVETSSCIFEPFYKDKLVIITPVNDKYLNMKEQGFHVKDILREPIIMREEGSGTRKEIKSFFSNMEINDRDLNIIATLNSIEAIKRSVANNMGISIVSNLAVEDYIKDNRVLAFDLAEENIYRNLYIVRNKEMYMSKPSLKFTKFIREMYK